MKNLNRHSLLAELRLTIAFASTSLSQTCIFRIISFYNSLKQSYSPPLSPEVSSRICHLPAIKFTSPSASADFLFVTGKEEAHLLDTNIPWTDVKPISRALFLQLTTFSLESWIFHYILNYFYQERMFNFTSLYKN